MGSDELASNATGWQAPAPGGVAEQTVSAPGGAAAREDRSAARAGSPAPTEETQADRPLAPEAQAHSPQAPETQAHSPQAHSAESASPQAPSAQTRSADAHSEQWRANASKAGEKIKAMFRS
jgi:hypothetical protein